MTGASPGHEKQSSNDAEKTQGPGRLWQSLLQDVLIFFVCFSISALALINLFSTLSGRSSKSAAQQ